MCVSVFISELCKGEGQQKRNSPPSTVRGAARAHLFVAHELSWVEPTIGSTSNHWNSGFTRRIKKGKGHNGCGDFMPNGLDGYFHLQFCSGSSMPPRNAGKRDHLFKRRRPRRGCGFANLLGSSIDRNGHA